MNTTPSAAGMGTRPLMRCGSTSRTTLSATPTTNAARPSHGSACGSAAAPPVVTAAVVRNTLASGEAKKPSAASRPCMALGAAPALVAMPSNSSHAAGASRQPAPRPTM
jgi:hypothetical protein